MHTVLALLRSVSEVANKIIWDSIVDDPVLFLRHFLEKLTNKERQVSGNEDLFVGWDFFVKCGCKTQGPFMQQNVSGWGLGPVFTLCKIMYLF